jgi:hypothetical protein
MEPCRVCWPVVFDEEQDPDQHCEKSDPDSHYSEDIEQIRIKVLFTKIFKQKLFLSILG